MMTDLDFRMRDGFEAALHELAHLAAHFEARGAYGSALALYDAIRIVRRGGLPCDTSCPSRPPKPSQRWSPV